MPKIPTKTLATHWAVTPGRVRQFRMLEGEARMPDFEDRGEGHAERFVEADTWRLNHAPPPRKKSAAAVAAAQIPEISDAGKGKGTAGEAPATDVFDANQFLGGNEDFDGWLIREAEDAVKIAAGLYRTACKTQNSAKIAAALDNFQQAAKRCREIRGAFIDLQARSASSISVDRAADIVGRELAVLVGLMDDFPARIAAEISALRKARDFAPGETEPIELVAQKAINDVLEQVQRTEAALTNASADPTAAASAA